MTASFNQMDGRRKVAAHDYPIDHLKKGDMAKEAERLLCDTGWLPEPLSLFHGGSPKGAEFIAARWADLRKVPQVVLKPDWTRHAEAAPFRRNGRLLQTMPIGVVVFPGSGITENLADQAKTLGIPVSRFGGGTCEAA
jgi:YspA, cpYpsA-related SLOG family